MCACARVYAGMCVYVYVYVCVYDISSELSEQNEEKKKQFR